MSQTVLNIRHTSEATGKNVQIALALTNGKAVRVHTGGLTGSWSSSAYSKCKFPSHQEEHKLAASAEQERNREDPQNKWFQQLLGHLPRPPSQGQQATSSRFLKAFPARCHGSGCAPENRGSQMSRECGLPLCAQTLGQVVQMLTAQKLIKKQGWWKGMFALFLRQADGSKVGYPALRLPYQRTSDFIDGARAKTV